MSPWLFTSAILEGRPIKVFNHGKMLRDFTFVEDIAEGTVAALDCVPTANAKFDWSHATPATAAAPFQVFNIGHEEPVELMYFIRTLETALGREAVKEYLPMQPGDLEVTRADVSALKAATGFAPQTSIEAGVARWLDWYRSYHRC